MSQYKLSINSRDAVVPEQFGLRLYDGCAGPEKLRRFPDGEHVSIMEPPARFWGEAINFWMTNPG